MHKYTVWTNLNLDLSSNIPLSQEDVCKRLLEALKGAGFKFNEEYLIGSLLETIDERVLYSFRGAAVEFYPDIPEVESALEQIPPTKVLLVVVLRGHKHCPLGQYLIAIPAGALMSLRDGGPKQHLSEAVNYKVLRGDEPLKLPPNTHYWDGKKWKPMDFCYYDKGRRRRVPPEHPTTA
ncbi:MAG: hypothetical protein RL141_737 [Candidatus Parcubacteria bacterium]|jgi:hypothetical protein